MTTLCFFFVAFSVIAQIAKSDIVNLGGEITTMTPSERKRRGTSSNVVIGETKTSAFTQAMIDSMLKAHNDYRAKESGANIKKLSWSNILADMGQAAAEYCEFAHLNYKYNKTTTFGQNVAMFSESHGDLTSNIAKAANAWFNEKSNYDITSNNCEDGKMCGHYLQMVLSRVSEMGCGIYQCDTVAMPNKDWVKPYLIFCNYNKIRKGGKKPFQPGEQCSNCKISPGWICEDKLCAACNPESDSKCTPYTCYLDDRIKDKYQNSKKCSKYEKKGYCVKKGRVMAHVCPRTCKLCPDWLLNEL